MSCCQVLGVRDFEFQQSKPETSEGVFQKCKKSITQYFSGANESTPCYLMGNAIVTTDLNEARETLINRDYPQMNNDQVGQIFVPQEFISKIPKVVSYKDYERKVDLGKEVRKTDSSFKAPDESTKNNIKGEELEREFSVQIRQYFQEVGDDVLVIHGHDFLTFGASKMEKDFLIVNKTHSYVLNLEIKHSASGGNLRKAFAQIRNTKEEFQKWMSGENVSSHWKFIGAIGCSTTTHTCCVDYVIKDKGPSNICTLLKKIAKLQVQLETKSPKHHEDFKSICSILLFNATATPAPVSSQFISQLSNVIAKAGDPKNIAFWCHWTPQQLSLMRGIENLPKVLLNTPPSTGKTTLLVAKAEELAKKGEDVLLLIYTSRHLINCHRLLEYQIRMRLDEWIRSKKIIIEPFQTMAPYKSENGAGVKPIDSATAISQMLEKYPNRHVLIDEMLLEYLLPKYDSKAESRQSFYEKFRGVVDTITPKTLWIAVAGISLDQPELKDEIYDSVFYDFEKPDLTYPLRNQRKIVEYAVDINKATVRTKSGYYAGVSTRFDLTIPENIPLGPDVTLIEITDLAKGLKKAFNVIKDYHFGVLIATTFINMTDEIKKQVKILRKRQPLTYDDSTVSKSTGLPEQNLDEHQVHEWMTKTSRKQDLIVHMADITGFESEVMIFIEDANKNVCPNYILRAICKLVILKLKKKNLTLSNGSSSRGGGMSTS